MLQLRQASERGHSSYGWLDSYHTFSFADYVDPKHIHVSKLRVLNDDTVAPGAGFPPHSHRDMEIVSYVLSGALQHKDSLGHVHTLHAGQIQRMSAGTGIVHSEYNASASEPLHFLQIWIFPDTKSIAPDYEIAAVPVISSGNSFSELVVPETGNSNKTTALKIHQDVTIYGGRLASDLRINQALQPTRTTYLHLARGSARVNQEPVHQGDGLTIKQEPTLAIETTDSCDMLLFDLP